MLKKIQYKNTKQNLSQKLKKNIYGIYLKNSLFVCFLRKVIVGWTCLVAQMVKRLPTTRDTWVQSLGWEDLLEKKMATHSSVLAWKIPWTGEPGRLQSMGSQSHD